MPMTIIVVLSITKPITAKENPDRAMTTAKPRPHRGHATLADHSRCFCHRDPISYTERAAFAASDAARLRSRAAAQSSSVIAVSPAKVFGPASRWPPSIAIVSPVR
jgi:hypothetical protein